MHTPDTIDATWHQTIAKANILLLQREIPAEINSELVSNIHDRKTVVILDMGGQDRPLAQATADECDYISPNETEALRWFQHLGIMGEVVTDEYIGKFLET